MKEETIRMKEKMIMGFKYQKQEFSTHTENVVNTVDRLNRSTVIS